MVFSFKQLLSEQFILRGSPSSTVDTLKLKLSDTVQNLYTCTQLLLNKHLNDNFIEN